MWSFGVMLFQMLTGKLPFKGVSEFQVFQEIIKNECEMPDSISSDAKDLISKLLVSALSYLSFFIFFIYFFNILKNGF